MHVTSQSLDMLGLSICLCHSKLKIAAAWSMFCTSRADVVWQRLYSSGDLSEVSTSLLLDIHCWIFIVTAVKLYNNAAEGSMECCTVFAKSLCMRAHQHAEPAVCRSSKQGKRHRSGRSRVASAGLSRCQSPPPGPFQQHPFTPSAPRLLLKLDQPPDSHVVVCTFNYTSLHAQDCTLLAMCCCDMHYKLRPVCHTTQSIC